MSRRKVQGVWVDEGPGAAGAVDGLAAMGRLSALDVRETAGTIEFGANAPIERRQVDAAQRDAMRAEAVEAKSARFARVDPPIHVNRPAKPRPALGSPEHLQASRMRGAESHVEVINAKTLPPLIHLADPAVTEEPPMPEPSSIPTPETEPVDPSGTEDADPLLELAKAAQIASAAFNAYMAADEAWEDARRLLVAAWAEVGLDGVEPAMPDHLPAQSIELADGTLMRAHSDGEPETIAALKELGEAAVKHLRDEAEGAEGLTKRQEEVLAAMRAGGGIKGAVPILGISDARVRQLLNVMRDDGMLPADVEALVKRRPRKPA